MKPADRPQSIDAFASLIDLPVSDVEALSTTIPLVAEPVVPVEPSVATPKPQVLAVNHAAATVEPLTPRNVRRLSPGLVVAAAIAVLAVVVVVWKANHHSEAPPVAASTAPAAPAAAAGNSVASSAPTVATVYLRLQAGENVMLNGEARDVKPSSSGFASLNLAAGNYRIEVRNGNQVHSQSLTIDKPGTWLINPAQ